MALALQDYFNVKFIVVNNYMTEWIELSVLSWLLILCIGLLQYSVFL